MAFLAPHSSVPSIGSLPGSPKKTPDVEVSAMVSVKMQAMNSNTSKSRQRPKKTHQKVKASALLSIWKPLHEVLEESETPEAEGKLTVSTVTMMKTRHSEMGIEAL